MFFLAMNENLAFFSIKSCLVNFTGYHQSLLLLFKGCGKGTNYTHIVGALEPPH